MSLYRVAVVGATGAVGLAMTAILGERDFPVGHFYPLASARSVGEKVLFQGKPHSVQDLNGFDFTQVDIALFSAGSQVSEKFVPLALKAGCVVIDNTSHFRQDPQVPLVVAEVNPHQIRVGQKGILIANPNCSTMQMLVALKPIRDRVGIRSIWVATYQAVSGSGKKGVVELQQDTQAALRGEALEPKVYPANIAFNVIPHIDVFLDQGYTKEEMKMRWETQKIFEDPSLEVNATAVRVPVFFGHSEAVHVQTVEPAPSDQVRLWLQQAAGVEVLDDTRIPMYPMPAIHAVGTDPVYVGRIRNDLGDPCGLNLWVVADNVRKGAALNAVQIAEIWAGLLS